MGGNSVKTDPQILNRHEVHGPHVVVIAGMPGDGAGGIIKQPGHSHIDLACAAFLSRAAVVAQGTRQSVGLHIALQSYHGGQRAGAQDMVAASVPGRPLLDGTVGGLSRFLTQCGERVIFTEKTQHRAAFSSLCHKGGLQSGHMAMDPKPLSLQQVDQRF